MKNVRKKKYINGLYDLEAFREQNSVIIHL